MHLLAVVLAAGLGKRLHPLTTERSKPMLPVAGKPMIERVVEQLADGGVDRFIFVVRPDDEPLLRCLEAAAWGGSLRVVFQEERLGMADAVARAAPLVQRDAAEEFILASCDNIYGDGHVSALASYRRALGLDAALTLLRVSDEQIPTLAVVRMDGERVVDIVEKPQPAEAPSNLGSAALYALTPRVLELLERVTVSSRGEKEFPDGLRLLIDDGGAVGGIVTESRMTLTSPEDLLALNRHYLRARVDCAMIAGELGPDVVVTPPVRIEEGAVVEEGCRIGPEVYLESGCRVGAGSDLKASVVLKGARVPPGKLAHKELFHALDRAHLN